MTRQPQVGDRIWYWDAMQAAQPCAAIVTEVQDTDTVAAFVLHPTDDRRHRTVPGVAYSPDPQRGCWSWPPDLDLPAVRRLPIPR